MADRERGAHVLAEVQLLQRDRIRTMLLEQGVDAGVDVGEAVSITPPSRATSRPRRRATTP
jgi:hypothetical protein